MHLVAPRSIVQVLRPWPSDQETLDSRVNSRSWVISPEDLPKARLFAARGRLKNDRENPGKMSEIGHFQASISTIFNQWEKQHVEFLRGNLGGYISKIGQFLATNGQNSWSSAPKKMVIWVLTSLAELWLLPGI